MTVSFSRSTCMTERRARGKSPSTMPSPASNASSCRRKTRRSRCWRLDATGRRVVTRQQKAGLRIWDTAKRTVLWRVPCEAADAVAFSPDGGRLALADGNRRAPADLGHHDPGELTARAARSGAMSAVAFSPDGRRLAGGGTAGIARVWNLAR